MTNDFIYRLTGTGWADVTFSNENQTITFEASYLNDPLSDLYDSLLRLIQNESNSELILFVEEPGEHSLLLTKTENGNLQIEIYWNQEWEEFYPDTEKQDIKKELVYSDIDTLDNLTSSIIKGTKNLLAAVGLEEYKDQWHLYEFPLKSFQALQLAII